MLTERGYIQTVSGRKVWLPGAEPESIHLDDIIHALSYTCRFAGHIDRAYSVAEHSVNVCLYLKERGCEPIICLQGLMHDATEAYLCDIPTPFKKLIPEYKVLEDDLWQTISYKFGIPVTMYPEVKEADAILLMSERDQLRSCEKDDWGDLESVPRIKVNTYTAASCRVLFRDLFMDLFLEVNSRK